jgi:uncharacterized C2H2 Zn-finger protein
MIARLIGWINGHKRGKRVTHGQKDGEAATFQCPRCRATWTRKAKPTT